MASTKITVREFFARFPTEEACLEHVMNVRFGLRHACEKCGKDASFHRLANRPAYSCSQCGAHVYPCAGTILQDTRTPLQMWFYAIYLFVTTRHGVSGKELERQLGVTYKTAWRIGHQIRTLMSATEGFEIMQGHVEIDEAFVGGKQSGKRGRGAGGKTVVVGMKERGGRVKAVVTPDAKTVTLRKVVLKHIKPGSTISTDQYVAYQLLKREGYTHYKVNHSYGQYAKIDYPTKTMVSVNGVENFWKLFKDSVRSTHIHVSKKYMQQYLDEFTFRSNHRAMKNGMFDLLVSAL